MGDGAEGDQIGRAERDSDLAERDDLHARDIAVKGPRRRDRADGEDQMVEALELHVKMDSGRNAETIQLGASTISLILRSTATLQRMYAASRLSPRSVARWSIM